MEVVAANVKATPIRFENLHDRLFMKYWSSFCITEFDEDMQAWKVTFWGTNLLQNYGAELTGRYFDVEEFGESRDEIVEDFFDAKNNDRTSYASGTIEWKNEEYKTWHRVVMPMIKSGKKCVLIMASFESE